MATLNVNEEYFTSPQRFDLAVALGGQALADGVVLNIWHVFWNARKARRPVTREALQRRIAPLFFEAAISANVLWQENPQKDEFKVIFEDDMFGWYDTLLRCASNGGKKGSRSGVKNLKQYRSDTGATPERDQSITGAKPESISLSLSSSSLRSEEHTCPVSSRVTEAEIEPYYARYPKRGAGLSMNKAKGMQVLTKKLKREELAEFAVAVETVRASRDSGAIRSAEFVPMWSTFATKWREYLPENGKGASEPFQDYGF